jgi:HSP20 family protein
MQDIIHDVEERLMGRFQAGTRVDPYQWLFEQTQWVPNMDLFTRGDSIVVRTELSGLSTEEVSVELEDGVLCISARSSSSNSRVPHADGDPFSEGFIRRLTLPDGVARDDLDVSFENGVLEIAFPLEASRRRNASRSAERDVRTHI